ncbi:MAG: NAD(+) synthase [Dysgonamonadaceae bacterium]|jgi:NAD+ synthase (glutamine-hydrolysing)|nr:NAD(+) synthase [Dysgonamonadaceae bacterium]
MNDNGFYRTAAAIPKVRVADTEYNCAQMKILIDSAAKKNVQTVCFPELSVTAYTCGDLFFQNTLTEAAEKAVQKLLSDTKDVPITFLIGAPVVHRYKLYNCALVCCKGLLLGVVPKINLPNYNEFYEKRWFEPCDTTAPVQRITYAGQDTVFGTNLLFDFHTGRFAVEICEDLWSVVPPSSYHAMAGAYLCFNLSASNELVGKREYIKSMLAQQSARCIAGYVYASAGFGESSTDTVYSGNAYVLENGKLLAESGRFAMDAQLIISEIDIELLGSERKRNTTFPPHRTAEDNYRTIQIPSQYKPVTSLYRGINPTPFIPAPENYSENCREIFSIQVAGLAQRFVHTAAKTLVLGVSGGLDSTLALLVCSKMADKLGLPRKMILGVNMPGFGTTTRTKENATGLMRALNVEVKEIDITCACERHFLDIGHDAAVHDVVYENTQARERTQILMDLANKAAGLVVGTGDMSELALGWATYSGDHISMYGVNSGVPKTLVRHLIEWVAENELETKAGTILKDVLDTPVSPELIPADAAGNMTQFTETVIGPYDLHDFILFYVLRYGFAPDKILFLAVKAFEGKYSREVIVKWMEVFYRRFFASQFKRSCMPDGPKIGSVNLSPRSDFRMPSDAAATAWLQLIK